MILTVDEYRQLVETDETDDVLENRLKAMEQQVRGYTHNAFTVRGMGQNVSMNGNDVVCVNALLYPLAAGDTVLIRESLYNDGLYTVESVDGQTVTLRETLRGTDAGTMLPVRYPLDVKLGVAAMMTWQADNADKAGIASETISRHSVTYADPTGAEAVMGYPKQLTAFLQPYKKARFGGERP